jgi:uncharacterized repeat protein (TIGR01451 family)
MFPQHRPHTPGVLRRLPLSSACLLVVGLLWSSTVWSQPGPRILHDGLSCILAGEHVILEALVEPPDELITIKAYFRADVYSLYYYVEMTRVGDVYQAVLPKPSSEISGVVYYLEAIDSAFNSVRTEEFHPEVVVDASSCRERNPTPPAYFDGPANITVGATGEGASFPPGFLTEGIVGTITAAGRVAASGGGVGTAVALAAAGGAAVGVGVLVSGGNDDTTTSSIGTPGGGTTSVTTTTVGPTTTSPGGSAVVACFDTSPDPPTIPVGGSVRFDASCTQPDRDAIATYFWRFNDGRGDREGRVINRVYNDEGVFPAELTVTTLDGTTDRISHDVRVEATAPPPPGGGGPGNVVTISKGGPAAANVGVQFSYTIVVSNTGASAATGVSMSDAIPPSLTINQVNFTANADNCGQAANNVTCTAANLAAGASFTVTIQVTPTAAGSITNVASVNVTNPSESSADSASTGVALRTNEPGNTRLRTRLTNQLDVPPNDGGASGMLTVNGSLTYSIESSHPMSFDVQGHAGVNDIDAVLMGGEGEGRWRFDFSSAPHFESGSFVVEQGQVLTRTPDEIVFRVGPDAVRVRFRFRLRR